MSHADNKRDKKSLVEAYLLNIKLCSGTYAYNGKSGKENEWNKKQKKGSKHQHSY